MCGICGIIKPVGAPVDRATLRRMRDALTHRGPDAAGDYLHENVGLGHRRLKIIDLSEAAAQPMLNEDGTVAVVFNGEIYNFQPLRAELEGKGHRFRSRSDTEVIVHGYEEWGANCLERFNGMFAFAVYDQRRREVFLARDRLGIKPLYYQATPGGFLFASEIKAFLECDGFRCELNDQALPAYLLFRSEVGPATLFRGVQSLMPGHWLRVRPDLSCEQHGYWDISPDEPTYSDDLQEQERCLLDLLRDSVKLQEISDVPIGVQLSGGVDSSLVTALMVERAAQPVQSYSVGFDETGYNELAYAREVAGRLHTNHHEVILDNDGFAGALEKICWQQDTPIIHANAAGIYWLCELAKPSATVLLTGEGADESFAGYYRYERLRKGLLAKRWCPPIFGMVPVSSRFPRLRLLQEATNSTPAELIVRRTAVGLEAFGRCFTGSVVADLIQERMAIARRTTRLGWLAMALYYDLKTYLLPLLVRQDKMSMAHAVEARVPFLDHRVVEFAFRLPPSLKLAPGNGKRIVKSIATRYLPANVLYRPKVGFAFPLEPWMRSRQGLGGWLETILDPGSVASRVLPRHELAAMVAQHQQGQRNHADALWPLVALEAWHRAFFKRTPGPRTDDRPIVPVGENSGRPKIPVAQVVLNLKVGGLERVVVNLVSGFRDSPYQSLVCCLEERGEFADEVEKLGVPLQVFGKRPGFDWSCIVRLAKFLRQHRVKIVHTHNVGAHFHGLAAAWLAGVPIRVHTRHGRESPDNRRRVLLNRVLSWGTDIIAPVSANAADVALGVEAINPAKLRRIWNGVDVDRYHPGDRTEPEPPVIGTVARLSPEKNYPCMLEAFRLVLNELPRARLVFAGDGPCAEPLRTEARRLGIDGQIDFLGNRSDVPELLRTFTLFSLSSSTEGLSMTLLEAMATGLPVAATDVGGNREIVNPPECGLLVPTGNARALADAYLTLLRDPARRARMGLAARTRIVDHFSIRQMVARYEEIYDSLAKRKINQ